MKKRIEVFIDYDGTLVNTIFFYLINPDLFLKNFVHASTEFIKSILRDFSRIKKFNLLNLIYYFLLEEDKRSDEIVKRMVRRMDLYIDKNLLRLILKLSERSEMYDTKIISSSSEKIIRGVISEMEKIYGKRINVEVIATTENHIITAEKKSEIVRGYYRFKICVADGPTDYEFSRNCNATIVKKTLSYYLSPKKPIGCARFTEALSKLEYLLTSKYLSE